MAKGRPSKYSHEIADQICELVATSPRGIRSICAEHQELPDPDTIYRWLRKYNEFYEQYARAKQAQLQAIEDEMIEIADDGTNDYVETKKGIMLNKEAVMRSALRIDTRKWLMSKLLPKKYGDKVGVELSGAIALADAIAKARNRKK